MTPQLGGSQMSALLESVPGIASVLRSPVADAMVAMIRAGAGAGPFHLDDAQELVQYAVRRGLISSDEGDELLAQARAAARDRSRAAKAAAKGKSKRSVKKPAKKAGRRTARKRR